MKVQELRIGNLIQLNPQKDWYRVDDYTVVVESISSEGINYTSFMDEPSIYWESLDDDKFVPIALTPEWLKKFGFTETEDYLNMLEKGPVFKLDEVNILYYKGQFSYGVKQYDGGTSEDWTFLTDINYVHQLQNLYFALTEKELHAKD